MAVNAAFSSSAVSYSASFPANCDLNHSNLIELAAAVAILERRSFTMAVKAAFSYKAVFYSHSFTAS